MILRFKVLKTVPKPESPAPVRIPAFCQKEFTQSGEINARKPGGYPLTISPPLGWITCPVT